MNLTMVFIHKEDNKQLKGAKYYAINLCTFILLLHKMGAVVYLVSILLTVFWELENLALLVVCY